MCLLSQVFIQLHKDVVLWRVLQIRIFDQTSIYIALVVSKFKFPMVLYDMMTLLFVFS